MAHEHHADIKAYVGEVVEIPLPTPTPGLVLGTLDSVVVMNTGGGYVADPVVTLGLTMLEVDDVNAPGLYLLSMVPDTEGTLFVHVNHNSIDYEFTVQAAVRPQTVDEGLEGDITLTIDDGTDPVPEATVRIYSVVTNQQVARGVTDALGVVHFALAVGQYQVRVNKDGVTFPSPAQTITVVPNADVVPRLDEVLPGTAAIGDYIVLKGAFFHEDTTEVLFGTEATVAIPAADVSADKDTLIVRVPVGLTLTIVPLFVRKPDPNDLPLGTLLSNSIPLVRV